MKGSYQHIKQFNFNICKQLRKITYFGLKKLILESAFDWRVCWLIPFKKNPWSIPGEGGGGERGATVSCSVLKRKTDQCVVVKKNAYISHHSLSIRLFRFKIIQIFNRLPILNPKSRQATYFQVNVCGSYEYYSYGLLRYAGNN